VEIHGDEELDSSVHYNLYQLIQSVAKDPHGNIAAKGLSGEGYEGHYFWDTEMYLQPFFTLTIPEIAKNLVRYRYSILGHARENAKLLGHKKGAAYPWRTIMGEECSGHYPSGSAQYHISGDVAYAVIAYYLATGDLDLIEECGAEIVMETARLWMQLGNYYKGKFYINEVTGPDEYTCLVNNNYYTNLIAKHNLRWAVKFYELLKAKGSEKALSQKIGLHPEELTEFQEASEKMYLPYDEELGINPQDDSFLQKRPWDLSTITEDEKPLLMHYHPMYLYRHMICKQADTVLAHFILEDEQDEETIRKSFAFYETVTTHDSSLSTCIFSVVASKLGLSEKAYKYFGDSAKLDLFNTHKNTKDGIHTANMGGTYMAIVYGFGGLRIKEMGLFLNPSLPAGWLEYRFRFSYRNSLIDVSVGKDNVVLNLLSGASQKVTVFGKEYELVERLLIARDV
jgi:alpha,alpha-trehalose phosphorylase